MTHPSFPQTWICSAVVVAALSVAATSNAQTVCGTGKILFKDEFATLDPSWSFVGPAPNGSSGPNRLSYTLPPADDAIVAFNQSSLYDDYKVCGRFSIEPISEKMKGELKPGLAFWGLDKDNYYTLLINPAWGSFVVLRRQNARLLYPVGWTDTPALKRGSGAMNDLSVAVKSSHATIMINGQKVIEFDGRPPEGGSLVGFEFDTNKEAPGPMTVTLKGFEVHGVE
jgi:hypothetical protein